ncbi:MAG TPA: ankyrin repeat domain-containing protein [Aggregicoccus sp.]|nr:ankyrin repeat domain-containing protein [Aggregicoccus sp.]
MPHSPALFEAVAAQDLKQLVKLLDAGEDPNPFDEQGLTPLMHAAAAGEELLVLALLDGGADPQLQDALGETAYLKAAAHGQRSLCAMLARFAGRDERALGETLLRTGTGPAVSEPGEPGEPGETPGAVARGLARLGAGVSEVALGDADPRRRLERAERAAAARPRPGKDEG